VDVYYYDGFPARFWTRAFNGQLPGPTLRVRRGDVVRIRAREIGVSRGVKLDPLGRLLTHIHT
jgi:hypothetical protein